MAKAANLLDVWCINDLFRHGFSATLELQQEARDFLDKPRFRAWYDLAETCQSDEPSDRLEQTFVTALRGHHPLCSGFNPADTEEVKAFACLADIDVAHIRLKSSLEECLIADSSKYFKKQILRNDRSKPQNPIMSPNHFTILSRLGHQSVCQ